MVAVDGTDGEPPREMKVLLPIRAQDPQLFVELTTANVEHLHKLCLQQISSKQIKRVHPRVERGLDPVGVQGVSRVYKGPRQGMYKFQKNRKRKYAKAEDDDDANLNNDVDEDEVLIYDTEL